MREVITCAQRQSQAIIGHSEAVIRGSSMVSGRQSSEVRQWSPGGSHQRFVNGLREARLSRECLELLLLLAQHARLMRKAIT